MKYLEAGYRSYLAGFESKAMSRAVTLVEVERNDDTRRLVVQERHCDAEGLRYNYLYAIFELPIHVYKGYPMSKTGQAEADRVLAELKDTHSASI